jgi:hypothetical protein
VVPIGRWVLLLAAVSLFIPFVLARRRRVWTNLCPGHANYWLVREVLFHGVMLVNLASTFAIAFVAFGNAPRWPRDLIAVAYPVWLAVVATWLGVAAVVWASSIRAEYISDKDIDLVNVHLVFVEALARRRESLADSSGSAGG